MYPSRYGHAFYSKPGLVLGYWSKLYIGGSLCAAVVEPPWLNYRRKWGPTVNHILKDEIDEILKVIPKPLRGRFRKFFYKLPREILEEEGPSSIKTKVSWDGDEI